MTTYESIRLNADDVANGNNILWYETDITLTAGDHLTIIANGRMSPYDPQVYQDEFANNYEEWLDPDGGDLPCGAIFSLEPKFILLGSIDSAGSQPNVTPFSVGTNYNGIVSSSGKLFLSINDCSGAFGDNRGYFQVTVIVNAPDECDNEGSCEAGIHYSQAEHINPIKLRSGTKVLSATDLTLNSPSGNLAFTRHYRQDRLTDTDYNFMGLGWSHSQRYTLSFTGTTPNREATINLPDGGVLKLDEGGPGNAGHFDARAGATSVLDHDTTNNQYVLTTQGEATFAFSDSAPYNLEKRTFANGEFLDFSYNVTDNLTQVVDDYSRSLNFSYYSGLTGADAFKNGQLWRIGDQTATGLDTATPSGRFITLDYLTTKSGGSNTSPAQALLSTMIDVRGETWTYDYYGQDSGETDTNQLNFLLTRISPSVDTTGDGTADGALTLEDLTYTLNGAGIITQIDQARGNGLITTKLRFQPNGDNITTEEVNGKVSIHHFANGVYVGKDDPAGNLPWKVVNDTYRPAAVSDANGNDTQMTWSSDGKQLQSVSDPLSNDTAFTYDTQDRLTEMVDAEGRETVYTYGDTNVPRQPTRIQVYESVGGPLLRQQEFDYDTKGRVTEERLMDTDGSTVLNKIMRTYHTSGDGNGLLHELINIDLDLPPAQQVMGSPKTVYTYDSVGRIIKTQKTSLFGSCEFSYTVYDAAGNIVATICGPNSITPIPENVTDAQNAYNASDLQKKDNRVTIHEYDALGRRVKTTVNAGMDIEQTTLTVYDALNRVIRMIANYVVDAGITNPYTANHSAFNYGPLNDENLVTDMVYDARGRMVQQTDPEGLITFYVYDDADRLVKTVRNAKAAATIALDPGDSGYDAANDPRSSSYTLSTNLDEDQVTEQVYDPVGNVVKSIDVRGSATFTVYDALNRPVKVVRNAKAAVTIDPNDVGYSVSNDPRSVDYVISNNPSEDHISETEYDALGRVMRTRQLLDKDASEIWTTTLYGYDTLGRQVRVIQNASDPDYNLATDPDLSGYPPASSPDQDIVSETAYDPDGRVMYTTDVNGAWTWTGYDSQNRPVKTVQNARASATVGGVNDPRSASYVPNSEPDQDIVSTTIYNSDGQVESTEDVLGRVTYHVYDADVASRRIRTIQNYVAQGASNPRDWYWNGSNWQRSDSDTTAIEHHSDLISNPDNDDQNLITDTIYDDQGRAYETRDHRGNVTRMVYSDTGRLLKTVRNYVAQGSSDPADWHWNGTNWQRSDNDTTAIEHRSDPSNYADNYDQNLITANEYDLVGRMTHTRDMAGHETRYDYDDLGRRTQTIVNYVDGTYAIANPDEDLISTTNYNRAGQVTETVDPRGTETAFTYDGAGRQQTVTRAANTSLAMETYTVYDKAGRVVRTIQNYEAQGSSNPAEWVWDEAAERWLYSDTDNTVVEQRSDAMDAPDNYDQNLVTDYTYDTLGRRTETLDPVRNSTQMVYQKDGQVASMTDPEGVVTAYRYDELRRRTLVVQNHDGVDVDALAWANGQWEEN